MLPETHPLIDSITQPLGDNAEMKLSAAQILEQTFDPADPSVPEAIERLEKQDKKKFPAIGKIVIWVLAVTMLTVAISSDLRSIVAVAKVHDWEWLEDIELPPAPRKLNQQERLIFGDPEMDELSQKQRLFESDPTNPAYFAEYARFYLYEHDSLPSDFLETAARIDPNNSFFIYLAAAVIGKVSFEQKSISGPSPPVRIVDGVKLSPLPRESEYIIKDQEAYDEALGLLKKASELPHFLSYSNQIIATKAHLLRTENFPNYLSESEYYMVCGVDALYGLSFLLGARAEELSKGGRKDDFLNLNGQYAILLTKLSNNKDVNIINEIHYEHIANFPVVNFQVAAERLKLNELEEIYSKRKDVFVARDDVIYIRIINGIQTLPLDRISPLGFSPVAGVWLQTQIIPPLHDSYLKPMRIVEHELLGRFGILMVSLLLMIGALIVFLFRFLTTKAILLPAKRIAMLLKLSDWIWIFSLGIAMPIVVFLYISRISPVSGRDYSCSHFQFAFPGIHLLALLLTLLLAPAMITRWRLTRRSAAFKFGSRLDLLALPVIGVMMVYAIVAYPVLMNVRINDTTRFGLSLPLLGWLAFVFFNGLRIFLGSARSRLIQTATAIAVIPAYPLAILALCLTLPIYIKAERQGLAEDKRIFIDPVTSELGSYEYKVAAQKRKEINAIMGY